MEVSLIERRTPPRGHAQTRRRQENTQRLRAAALQEFAQHGLHGAKVSNIVAAAHLTQPSFYRLWPSKEAAYEELIASTTLALQATSRVVMDGPDDWTLEERLSHGLETLFRALTGDLAAIRLLSHARKNDPDPLQPFLEVYRDVFQNAQDRGWVTARLPAETLAEAVLALVDRFFQTRLYSGLWSIEVTTRELTQLILPVLQDGSQET